MAEKSEVIKTLILGSGPAGYTAAIYAARANLFPVLYEGSEPGGQLMITTDVENFPGYADGVQGPQMMEDLKNQAKRMGADIRMGYATSVDFSNNIHKVIIDGKFELQAETVIISTGASAKWLGIESETRLNGHGVSACAVCDGFFFKGKELVVVGGGDTACEEASYLSKMSPKVHMLVRKDEMRASKVMQQRVINTENIEIYYNTETVEILGEDSVTGVKVKNNKTNEESVIEAHGFFVAIGHTPNTEIFKDYLDMDESGYLITKNGNTHTNVEGVFVAGDAQDKIYRQAVTAAGTGCMAALDADRYLAEKEMSS